MKKLPRTIKYSLIRLLRINSNAKDISFGLVLGFLPNWIPTFGFGPVISIALAKLFKANIVSAFIGGISGALLWPVLFVLNYKVGNFLLSISSSVTPINDAEIEAVNLFYYKTKNIGVEFLVGATVNIIIFSLIFYFAFYYLLKKYQKLYLKRFISSSKRMQSSYRIISYLMKK